MRWTTLWFGVLVATFFATYGVHTYGADQVRVACKVSIVDASPSIDKKNPADQQFAINVDQFNMQIFRSVISDATFIDNLLVQRINDVEMDAIGSDPEIKGSWRKIVRVMINRIDGKIEILERFKLSGQSLWAMYRGSCLPYETPKQKF